MPPAKPLPQNPDCPLLHPEFVKISFLLRNPLFLKIFCLLYPIAFYDVLHLTVRINIHKNMQIIRIFKIRMQTIGTFYNV